MADEGYPVFVDPEKYMKLRVSRSPLGRMKTWSEQRALSRCLSATTGIRTVLDIPCGPGRLFPYWRDRGFQVIGMDFSAPMAESAGRLHSALELRGSVSVGDAFKFSGPPAPAPELVASVRFVYYFDGDKRVELLRSLAAASVRYVLVQYNTVETYRGRRNAERSRHKRRTKHFATHQQILDESGAAGLNALRIEPVSELSERVFVLLEKPQAGAPTPPVQVSKAPGRALAAVLRPLSG